MMESAFARLSLSPAISTAIIRYALLNIQREKPVLTKCLSDIPLCVHAITREEIYRQYRI